MTINFTSGLIRVENTYYNPESIQKFNSTNDKKTQLFFNNDNIGSLTIDTDAHTFAEAFIEAQRENIQVSGDRKINYFG